MSARWDLAYSREKMRRTTRKPILRGYNADYYKVYDINVQLPKSIGEGFLAEYRKEGHGKLADADTFREYFPGLYFTTSFGNSTILSVNLTSLDVHYHYTDKGGSSSGTDTIRTSKFA